MLTPLQSSAVRTAALHTLRAASTMSICLHVIWGREAVARYRAGVIDDLVRHAHAAYSFDAPGTANAFLLGVRQASLQQDWALVTNLLHTERLGVPLRSRLIDAARRGDVTTVRALLDSGVKPGLVDEQGQNALHHAAQRGHGDVANVLIDYGAEVDEPAANVSQKTALHLASESDAPGTAFVVQVLLEREADPRIRDANGSTALHLLANADAGGVASPADPSSKLHALLGAGADPRERNDDGLTAMQLIAIKPDSASQRDMAHTLREAAQERQQQADRRAAIMRSAAPRPPQPY